VINPNTAAPLVANRSASRQLGEEGRHQETSFDPPPADETNHLDSLIWGVSGSWQKASGTWTLENVLMAAAWYVAVWAIVARLYSNAE